MNFQLLIDLVLKVSFEFRIEQRGGNVVLVKFNKEEDSIKFIEEISVYEEFSVVRNKNEVLVSVL